MNPSTPGTNSSSNFHLALYFLRKEKRQGMFYFYDFCRRADDIVDDVMLQSTQAENQIEVARGRLRALEAEVKSAFSQEPTTPLGERLAWLQKRFPVKLQHFLEIIQGCEMDLYKNRYQSFEELYRYCYHVASAVGLVSIDIFGGRSLQAKEYAVNLGIAFQLTNILRDLREDFERGRVYLPAEDLARFRYTEDDLRSGRVTKEFHTLMRFECERVLDYYAKAKKDFPVGEQKQLLPAQIMREIYFALFRKIQKQPEQVFKERVKLSKFRKLGAVASAFLGAR